MNNAQLLELNAIAARARSPHDLLPLWRSPQLRTHQGAAIPLSVASPKEGDLVLHQPVAPDALARAHSMMDYLALIAGSGLGVSSDAVEVLNHDTVVALRRAGTLSHEVTPILSRACACLILLGPMPDGSNSLREGGCGRYAPTDIRSMAQRRLSELLLEYPILMCPRIFIRPSRHEATEYGPISHAIAISPLAEFPRMRHGGGIINATKLRAFVAHPLTRLALSTAAPTLGSDVARMQGRTVASCAYPSSPTADSDELVNPGLVASLVELHEHAGVAFPSLHGLEGSTPGIAGVKCSEVRGYKEAVRAAVLLATRAAGLCGPAKIQQVPWSDPVIASSLAGSCKAISASVPPGAFLRSFESLVESVISADITGSGSGSLDVGDRTRAVVSMLAQCGPFGNRPGTDVAHSAARWLLGEILAPAPDPRNRPLDPAVPLHRFSDVTSEFAQRILHGLVSHGVTTRELRAAIAWCRSPTAAGWIHAIELIEAQEAMKSAIDSARVACGGGAPIEDSGPDLAPRRGPWGPQGL